MTKELLWQKLLAEIPHDPTFAICDSFPLPACLFARAYRCKRFKGEAAFGKDTLLKQTFYGFRVHVRVCWPGVITRISVAPANAHELSVIPENAEGTSGPVFLQEERPYPEKERLSQPVSLPDRHRFFAAHRALFREEGLGARPVASGKRLLRKVLSHTVAFLLNHRMGNQPLQLWKLFVR